MGLANFGFLLWLPVNLSQLGVDPKLASDIAREGRGVRAARHRRGGVAVPALEFR